MRRQLADCRAEAERRGWRVAGEYVDDDLSASSYGRRGRPEYRRLLADIGAGVVDAVICWHIDRLHRQPIELEEFVKVCTTAGVSDVVTLHGDFNLGSGDGLLVARLLAAVAANESDAKSRRSRRKMEELAQQGKPHGGGPRPFGFQADRITHDLVEAEVIRQLAARVLAGESISSVCRWMQESGVATVTGAVWRPPSLRDMLLSPRIWGMRQHRGQVAGPGVWEPIIDAATAEQLRVLLTDPARKTVRSARRYVLSGLCRCGVCGAVLLSGASHGTRAYQCRTGPAFAGCGHISITAEHVESVITSAVLLRLDSPELAAVLSGAQPGDDAETSRLHDLITADTTRLEELATAWADGELTGPEWRAARTRIDTRLTASRKQLAGMRGHRDIASLAGQGGTLTTQWDSLPVTRQAAIVKAVVDHVRIDRPTLPGRRGVDLARIHPIWRV